MQTLETRPDGGRPDRYRLYLLRDSSTEAVVGALQYLFELTPEEAREHIIRASLLGRSLLDESIYDDIEWKRRHLEGMHARVRVERV